MCVCVHARARVRVCVCVYPPLLQLEAAPPLLHTCVDSGVSVRLLSCILDRLAGEAGEEAAHGALRFACVCA